MQFQILESRLNKLRAFDLITRIGSIETERTRVTPSVWFEITNTKIRSCQFRCFANNTVNVCRFTFFSMDLTDKNLGSSKLLEIKIIYRLNSEDFSNFFLFRWISFLRFFVKNLYSELQSRDMHHKIRYKIPCWTVFVRSPGAFEENWFYTGQKWDFWWAIKNFIVYQHRLCCIVMIHES